MRRYIRMISRTAACLLAALLVFAACRQSDNDIQGLDIPESTTRCLLQPPAISIEPFGGSTPATRAALAIKEEQQAFNVGEELGNIITLCNSKTEDIPSTRAITNGTYYRIVVYKLTDWNNNTMKVYEQRLCKQGSSAYFSDLGDVTTPIYLYPGSYKIFCYSFNKTANTKMGKLADGAVNVSLSDGDDFMSVVKDLTITSAQLGTNVALGTITLQHRCSQLIGILTSVAFTSTGIAASPAPSLSATSTFTTTGNWSIKGTSFAATATASQTKAFTMAKSGNDYKGTMVILPLTSKALSANYNFKPNGSSKNITASNKSVNTGTTFASGGSYSFTIKAIGAYVITEGVESLQIGSYTWATRNVRYDNKFETNLNLWESGNLRGASQASTANEPVNSDYNSYFMWGNKTAFVNGGSYNTGSSDWPSSTSPCPSGYTVPTKAQLENLITKKIPQNKRVFINGETHTISNAYGFYNGNNARGLVLLDGSNVLFLPAAGRRHGTSWYNVGSFGYCWSSTPNGIYAYYLYFGSGSCGVSDLGRVNGFSVRCVK